jgi:hypothetical protein
VSKKKLAFLGLILIVVSIVGVNWYVGNLAGEELKRELDKAEVDNVTYNKLKVNPLLRTVTLTEAVINSETDNSVLTAEKLTGKLTVEDFAALLKQKPANSLDWFKINCANAELSFTSNEQRLTAEDLTLVFSGDFPLKKTEEEGVNYLLDRNQEFKVVGNNLSVYSRQLSELMRNNQDEKHKFNNIEQFTWEVNYRAEEQKMVQDFEVNSSLLSGTNSVLINYQGDKAENFKITDYFMRGEDMEWTLGEKWGSYELASFSLTSDLHQPEAPNLRTAKSLPKGRLTYRLEDFKIEFGTQLKKQMRDLGMLMGTEINLNSIRIKEGLFNYNYDGQFLNLTRNKLDTSYFTAIINGSFKLDESSSIEQSTIQELTIKLSDLNSYLESGLNRLQQQLGVQFPQDEEGNIIIRFTGRLADPKLQL